MTKEEKLDFILDYLKIKNIQVANEFKVSNGTVSQWRNKKAKKLNRVHLLAFEKAFNIPIYIFEDENIKTKEQIIEILSNKQMAFKESKIDLIGSWYLYFYENKKVKEAILELRNNNIIHLYINNKFYQGYFLTVSSKESIITIDNQDSNESFLIIINKNEINNKAFFASLSHSNNSEPIFEYILMSKNKIALDIAKYLLGSQIDNGTVLSYTMKEKLKEFLNKPQIVKPYLQLYKHLLGEWYIYFNDNLKFYKIIIKEDDRVDFYFDDDFIKTGFMTIDDNGVKIIFKKDALKRSYLFFNKTTNYIKIACYKGYEAITNDNILKVALLSKKRLNKEEINKILNPKECREINVDNFRRNLLNYLNEKE